MLFHHQLFDSDRVYVCSKPPSNIASIRTQPEPRVSLTLFIRCLQADLATFLEVEHKIVVKTRPHHSPEFPEGNPDWANAVRLSLHVFNTEGDVHRFLRALRTALS